MTALTPPENTSEELTLSDNAAEQSAPTHLSEGESKRAPLPPRRPTTLTGASRRALRAQGHHLKPVVQIGQAGLSEGVIEATKVALEQHELIKVSINGESPTERKSGAEQLAEATGAHVAQVIGRVILLYREREMKPGAQKPVSKLKSDDKSNAKKSPKKGTKKSKR